MNKEKTKRKVLNLTVYILTSVFLLIIAVFAVKMLFETLL